VAVAPVALAVAVAAAAAVSVANEASEASEAADGVENPIYAAFISQQVAVEEARKASLEARGVATITASGALATVLLGIVTLTKSKNGTFVLPEPSRPWLQYALIAFVVATVLAIATNFPAWLYWTKPKKFSMALDALWQHDAATSQREVADFEMKQLKRLHGWNDAKGYALMGAMLAEATAIFCVAFAVWDAL